MSKRKQSSSEAAPAILSMQALALDPSSLLQAYRRAVHATKRGGTNPSIAQSQFAAALLKLRARLKQQAPILRASGLYGVAIPRVDDGAFGAASEFVREVFWRRQKLFNEGVAAVVNTWPQHAANPSSQVWLKDEIRPHVRSMPMAGPTHRSGFAVPTMIWGAKALTTASLTLLYRRALNRLQDINALLFRALEALVAVESPPEAELEGLVAELAELSLPGAVELPSRLGFREQERFIREVSVALAALLLPGEGALSAVYSSWRTEQESRSSEELSKPVAGTVSFIFAGEAAGANTDEILSSLQCQPGQWEAFVQDEGRTPRAVGPSQRLPFSEIRARVTGEWIALVTEPVTFAPHVVEATLAAARREPTMRLAYSDHDERSLEGGFVKPFFKPGWSPDLFFEADYLGGVLFVSREVFTGWASGVERITRAEVCRLVLSAQTRQLGISRIPRVLWHRPSTAHPPDPLELAPVIQEHLQATGHQVELTAATAGRRVKWLVKGSPLVSIIVPFKDKPELLEQLINSFERYENWRKYEFILVSNNSRNGATFRLLSSLKRPEFIVREWDHPFNYQSINNHAVKEWARGEHLLFLNNDISWAGPGVIEELVGHSQRKEIGVVGANLRFPRGRLQHAGVALGMAGFAAHPFSGVRPDAKWTAYGLPGWTRNYLAVTGACMMMRRSVFDEVKGFDEQLVVSGGDVDLCLRIRARGYRVVNTPHVNVTHHESATRSGMVIPDSDAWKCFESFHPYIKDGDPYYNPNLSLTSMDVLPRLDHRTAEELATQLLSVELASSRQLLPL